MHRWKQGGRMMSSMIGREGGREGVPVVVHGVQPVRNHVAEVLYEERRRRWMDGAMSHRKHSDP